MNGGLCTKIITALFFVSVMPACAMDTEVLEKKAEMTVDITIKSLALGRTVNSYCFGNENHEKCKLFGWNYGDNDELVEVAISSQDFEGKTIDCLKNNPPILLRALLQASINDQSRASTLMHDLRTPQFPRYMPIKVLCDPAELILDIHGCKVKANIFIAGGLVEKNFYASFKNTFYLAAGGFGLTVISCFWLLEKMKLFGA